MTLKVNHIVLHQLVKQDESTLQMILRDSLLTVSDATEQMMEELHRVYSAKAGKAYGLFDTESQFAEKQSTGQCTKKQKSAGALGIIFH